MKTTLLKVKNIFTPINFLKLFVLMGYFFMLIELFVKNITLTDFLLICIGWLLVEILLELKYQ